MRITDPLLAPFEIEADSDQFTLLKIGIAASGKSQGARTESPVGYYTSIESCLHKIVKEQILSESESMNLDAYVKATCEKLAQFKALQLAA